MDQEVRSSGVAGVQEGGTLNFVTTADCHRVFWEGRPPCRPILDQAFGPEQPSKRSARFTRHRKRLAPVFEQTEENRLLIISKNLGWGAPTWRGGVRASREFRFWLRNHTIGLGHPGVASNAPRQGRFLLSKSRSEKCDVQCCETISPREPSGGERPTVRLKAVTEWPTIGKGKKRIS